MATSDDANRQDSASPRVRGSIDGFEGQYLTGWAIAVPDDHTCVIEVRDESGHVVVSGRATRARPDLAVLGFGRTSFAFRIPLGGVTEAGRFRVTADGHDLPGSPVAAGHGSFDGFFELANGHVDGWVTERAATIEPPEITLAEPGGAILATVRARAEGGDDPFFRQARFYLPVPECCLGRLVALEVRANGVRFGPEIAAGIAVQGGLIAATATRVIGWAGIDTAPARRLGIEVWRDGVLAGEGVANLRLPHSGVPAGWDVGFDIALDPPEDAAAQMISLRLRGGTTEMFGGPILAGGRGAFVMAARRAASRIRADPAGVTEIDRAVIAAALAEYAGFHRHGPATMALRLSGQPGPAAASPIRLTVVMPIYRGVDITRACIESVLAHRDAARDAVLLINDASPEPEMAAMLAGFASAANLTILDNPANLGFIKSVNRGFNHCVAGDVLLLNSDTVVFPGAFAELHAVAHAAADIATVTALSNNATIFNYPVPEVPMELLADAGWDEIAAAALAANRGIALEVPTGHGFCMLIRRDALDRVGRFNEAFGRGYGEENEFCQRAADLGFRHVAAGGVLVEHRERTSFGVEREALLKVNLPRLAAMYPEYDEAILAHTRADPLWVARLPLDAHRLRKARAAHSAAILVVGNQLGGGTLRAEREIGAGVGYDGAMVMRLSCTGDGRVEIAAPAIDLVASLPAAEWRAALAVLGGLGIERVLVHHLLGFTADAIGGIADFAAGRRMIAYVHDFHAVCPRVTLIDALGAYCGGAAVERCVRCVALGGAHEASRTLGLAPAAHRALFADLLGRANIVIAPSRDTAARLEAMLPGLAVRDIAHPHFGPVFPATARGGGTTDIALLGAIGPHKGSAELLRLARHARLTHPDLRFHVIGFTDDDEAFGDLDNVTITGEYEEADLPGLIAASGARVALFLHIWPETFSYTLSEAVAQGLIPVVPDLGAPAERVRRAGFGAIFTHPIDPAAVLDLIAGIASGQIPHGPGHDGLAGFATPDSAARIAAALRGEEAAPEAAKPPRGRGKKAPTAPAASG